MARAKPRKGESKTTPFWWVSIPKPPDYSTPEAISERAFERGESHSHADTREMYRLLRDKKAGTLYRQFREACAKGAPCDLS